MYKCPDTVKEIIEGVLLAPNPVRYLARYVDDPSARDITFLLFDGNQETNFRGISHESCANKYHIVNLGCYERTVVLSTAILSEKREELLLKTEYLINLDSNMVSFLPGLLKNGPIDSGFLEFLRYVKQNRLNLDLLPHLLEDSLNSTGMRNHARAYECLLAFFAFDRRSAQEIGDLPYRPDTDDYCCADNA